MKTFGFLIAFIFILLLDLILFGFALTKLWGWFIVPKFNLPDLAISQSIGIGLVVGLLTKQMDLDKLQKQRTINEAILDSLKIAIGKPLTYIVFGWVTFQFI